MVRALLAKKEHKDSLSTFQTLIVSTATRVGMGNLVGVVAAVSAGGAGAVFWMWLSALVGSSTAFIEATLAQLYRQKDPLYGGYRGGPAYYIHAFETRRRPGKRRRTLIATLFAISGLICWCGISQVVSNSVTSAFENAFEIPPLWTTVVLVVLAALIVLRKNATVKVLDVLVPIMYGVAAAMGGPQVFEALLPMLEGDFRQMDASSFAALRENLDSLNITAQQRKALLQLLSSGVADICAQSQATTLANIEALLQELKALNPNAQIVLVGYYNPLPLLPAPANPFVKHFRTLSRSVQKLAQQYDAAFAPATYTVVANDAHPTVCGHKYLARQILKALEK